MNLTVPSLLTRSRRSSRGQSVVEFSIVAFPLVLILLGIIQFGFIFNAYVTASNAAREGARAGSIFVADPSATQAVNDAARQNSASYGINAAVHGTLGLLDPAYATIDVTYADTDASCPSGSGAPGWSSADVRRKGHYVCVTVTYDLELLIALFGSNLDITARSQMVIN